MSAPAVVVMASAARARPELRELLGEDRVARLERLLLARATQWAEALCPGRVTVADDAETVLDAVQRLLAGADGGPALAIWPVLPGWRREHADGVLDDLDAGCEASVGPVFDGGVYMLALAKSLPTVLALSADAWESPDALGLVLGAINEEGVAVGLLRAERGLRRPADVRAALADPLLDAELRALLQR